MTDEARLRGLASKATPGPWYITGRLMDGATFFGDSHWNVRSSAPDDPERGPHVTTSGMASEADAAYIAAANPTAILALLDEKAALREALAEVARWPSTRRPNDSLIAVRQFARAALGGTE